MALTDWRNKHGNFFEKKLCVVTGGAGFIGSHLAEALLTLGARVVVLDDLSRGDAANIELLRGSGAGVVGGFRFVEGSITDRATTDTAIRDAEFVFHQAAWGSVPGSVDDPAGYFAVNETGTMNVLEAARAGGVGRVMFAASSSAYGDTEVLPKVETMPVLPRSPYAGNKAAGEAMLRAWACSYGRAGGRGDLDTVALRYFNIFGPRQNANSAYAAVIAAFAKALLGGERPVIYGDGEQSRDFTFVDNAVHANLLAARRERTLGGEVVNVACGRAVTVNDLATQMAAELGRPELTPQHEPPRAGDVKHSLADLTRAEALLGYEPIVGFAQGLAATVAWCRQEHEAAGG